MQLGHDNAGMSPNWLVEHVVVRNEVTGQTYKFACGRWLGRSIDDGSTERVLVGEPVAGDVPAERLSSECSTPPRCRSPSVPRRPHADHRSLQQALGESPRRSRDEWLRCGLGLLGSNRVYTTENGYWLGWWFVY